MRFKSGLLALALSGAGCVSTDEEPYGLFLSNPGPSFKSQKVGIIYSTKDEVLNPSSYSHTINYDPLDFDLVKAVRNKLLSHGANIFYIPFNKGKHLDVLEDFELKLKTGELRALIVTDGEGLDESPRPIESANLGRVHLVFYDGNLVRFGSFQKPALSFESDKKRPSGYDFEASKY